MKTEYKSHTIRFDGRLELSPKDIPDAILRGVQINQILVTQTDSDVDEFNKRSDVKIELASTAPYHELSLEWNIPDSYKQINIQDYIFNVLASKIPEGKKEEGLERLKQEYEEIKNRNLFGLLRAIIFVFDEFRRKKVVWGVGRGSSCASYVLYLIGVHSVDPIKFNIPLSEFFHD